MTRRPTSVATPVAHLIGPGQIKIVNGHVAFASEGTSPSRLDPQALKYVLCYGRVGITDQAVQRLLVDRVAVAWLTPAGNRCLGRLVNGDSATALNRLSQVVAVANPHTTLTLARNVVIRKIVSQQQAARHYQRQGSSVATEALTSLQGIADRAGQAPDLDALRGHEGAATRAWYQVLGTWLREPWVFKSRVRRPPTDPVNALLSLGYTWLLTRMVARIEAAGLEPALGCLHEFRPGRPSLACDLIEPLRVDAVDRWVISMCNGGRLTAQDFQGGQAGTRLTPEAFPRVLVCWEEHWWDQSCRGAMDNLVNEFIQSIRKYGEISPDPSHRIQVTGGSGEDATR